MSETKKLASFRTVTWRWMQDELVDDDERRFEIYLRGGELIVRTPAAWVSIRQFLLSDVGQRIRYIYRILGHHRLEALNGAILDLYPCGSERLGLGSIAVEGGELDGRAF